LTRRFPWFPPKDRQWRSGIVGSHSRGAACVTQSGSRARHSPPHRIPAK
jgi:hypothetical protein